MTQNELTQLGQIARVTADRDLAALARISSCMQAAEQEARVLETAGVPWMWSGEPDAALQAGANARWDVWREGRLRALQAERARLAVQFKAAHDAARISFGRAQALDTLQRRGIGLS